MDNLDVKSSEVSFLPPADGMLSRATTEASLLGIGEGAMPTQISIKSGRTGIVKVYHFDRMMREDGARVNWLSMNASDISPARRWFYKSTDNHFLEILND